MAKRYCHVFSGRKVWDVKKYNFREAHTETCASPQIKALTALKTAQKGEYFHYTKVKTEKCKPLIIRCYDVVKPQITLYNHHYLTRVRIFYLILPHKT